MGTSQSGFRGVMTWSINWDKYDIAQNTSSRVNFSSIDSHMGGGGGDCTPITCQTGDCGSKPNGCGGTLSCGSCSGGATCNSSYRCTTCSPQTCAGLGATCGAPSNGCGGTLSCGSCGTFFSCDSSFSCVSTLRSHWKMDAFMNGTNNVYDETGANNQIAFASTAVRPSIVTGKIGSAMQFDGVDDQGTVPSIVHSRIAGGSGASISAWLKSDGPKSGCSGTNCRQQVFYSYTSDAGGSLTMRLSENYELTCGGRPGTGTSNPWTEAKIKYTWQGVWTHAVCVLDAANDRIRIYVNGSEVTNITASWAATSVVNANIATADNVGGGASRYFKGAIDQLKLFNKVLTTSEITSLYQEAGSTCTPLTCQTGDCGSKPNGCGGTLSCGSCQTGYTCNSSNRCVSSCTPTTCQTGDCGAKPNGCGGTLSCGSCATGQSCNASYKCATTCTPTTCPTGGCGSMSDGCSGTLNCGSCPTGYSCNTSNQCVTSTGGGCTTLKAWSATEDWTVYTSDPWRKHNNRKWECHTAGWCYLEPGGANSSLGWTDRGAC